MAEHATPELLTSPQAKILVCGGAMMNGNHFADSVIPAMTEHYGESKHVALVLHSNHPGDRDKMERRLKEAFAQIGVPQATSLHQMEESKTLDFLREVDAIFVGGGDTFALLRDLRTTGQLEVIQQQALKGIPTGGTSAGANVQGPVIGTTNDFPVNDIATRDALSLFPALINPHHPKPEDEQGFASREWKIHNYRRWNPNEIVLALGDRSIAVLKDGKVTLPLGPAWLYNSEEARYLVSGDAIPELDP
ncbi:MAG: Type 1 glutamine amidotransferase-like domain-containing protein [Opitutales bacterium]|jgi:dipeptidase E|nr:Type 1 glutamine amidotransferase-like domain-containing protein [Opitutales bacterium]